MKSPMIRITTSRTNHTAAIYRDPLDTYAWPGGYTVVYVDPEETGAYLCATCASVYLPVPLAGVFYEGPATCCAACATRLEPSYSDTDQYPMYVEAV